MPAQLSTVITFLNSPHWTDREKIIIRWQYRMLGGFQSQLMTLISTADEYNLRCLALGFPDEVGGYRAWIHSNLAERLRAAGLDI